MIERQLISRGVINVSPTDVYNSRLLLDICGQSYQKQFFTFRIDCFQTTKLNRGRMFNSERVLLVSLCNTLLDQLFPLLLRNMLSIFTRCFPKLGPYLQSSLMHLTLVFSKFSH